MTSGERHWPQTTAVSLLCAATTWVTLWSWGGFVESPSGFLIPLMVGCVLVAVAGVCLRAARLPSALVALGQVLVVLVWLNRSWAEPLMAGGWVPTTESMQAVGDRVAAGATTAQAFMAPVPASESDISAVLIVTGVGVAIVVDLLACGLRRVPLAGLPLLAVYAAPVSILESVDWWRFAAAALAFLLLLATDEAARLSAWGRPVSTSGGESGLFDSYRGSVSTATVHSSARRIGVTATALAVAFPLLVPTLSTTLFQGNGSGAGGDGDGVSLSNPMADLKRDLSRGADVDLLSVTTTDPDPSYLRISVLDFFDGTTWKPSGRSIPVEQRADGAVPPAPGLKPGVPRTPVQWRIRIGSQFDSTWLPTPYPISSIQADGDWRYDTSTMDFVSAGDDQTTRNLDYNLTALNLRPSVAALTAAPPASPWLDETYTGLPASVASELRTLSQTVTRGSASDFEAAVRLQDWFRRDGGFTYTLDRAAGNGTEDLMDFLSAGPDGRRGYCEQFAAAMALLGRSLGIPSRVAVGFLRPSLVSLDTYVYSAHDLHSWPELYFEGIGWIRFEPTPSDRAVDVPAYTTRAFPDREAPSAPSASAVAPDRNRIDAPTSAPVAADRTGSSGSGGGTPLLGWLAAGLVVLLLAGAPRLLRSAVRRQRWSPAHSPVAIIEAGWEELRDTAADLAVPWDDSTTLRVAGRDLLTHFGRRDDDRDSDLADGAGDMEDVPRRGGLADPAATKALERLVRRVERARFARSEGAWSKEALAAEVAADVKACADALRAGVKPSAQWRATWLPLSLVAAFRRRRRSRLRGIVRRPGVDVAT